VSERIGTLPRYNTTFTCTAGSPAVNVDFSAAYKQHQSKMISMSSNDDAGASIHGVGYGMINGILQNAGFFPASNQSGLWLGGDYQDNPQGKYPYSTPRPARSSSSPGRTSNGFLTP
jgi:hypothetical protein